MKRRKFLWLAICTDCRFYFSASRKTNICASCEQLRRGHDMIQEVSITEIGVVPCSLCGYGAFCAIEAHRKDTRETLYGTPFCQECAVLFCAALRPFTNPNVIHFMHTRLRQFELSEVN